MKTLKTLLPFVVSAVLGAQAAAQTCSPRAGEVRMVGVGDIIFHGALLEQAMNKVFGFESFLKNFLPYTNKATLRYGNLEGPAAEGVNSSGQIESNPMPGYDPNGNIYSPGSEGKSYTFNFHPDSVRAVQASGFDVLSTANNHSADRGKNGVEKTLELLHKLGINAFGTNDQKGSYSWTSVVEKNGIRFGFVACTYGTNTGSDPKMVLRCFSGSEANPSMIKMIEDLKQQSDVVILTPHWGTEYAPAPNGLQKTLASAAIKAGARVIIGSHPHVLQPVEIRKNADESVQAIVAYSMGNWVTNQHPYNYRDAAKQDKFFVQRPSAMMFLSFIRDNGDVEISAPKFVPTYMAPKDELDGQQRTLLPAYPELYAQKKFLQNQVTKARTLIDKALPAGSVLTQEQAQNIFQENCQ